MSSALDRLSWLSEYGDVCEREPLARHTTLRFGGLARWFVRVRDRSQLVRLLERLQAESVPWHVLGGGTNTLAKDGMIEAVVLRPELVACEIQPSGDVSAESGVVTAAFARKVTEAGFTGWEWGVGLPGTIGGAIVGNAGCFGGETANFLQVVEVWSPQAGRVERYTKERANFGYRESVFKHEAHVILGATWQLPRCESVAASRARMEAILAERRAHQPLGKASAGCLFLNPVLTEDQAQSLEIQLGEPIPASARSRGRISAGWLLDRFGCKGMRFGTVQLSDVHANFLLPDVSASSKDLFMLRDHVQRTIFEKTGISLEMEWRILE